MKIAAVLFYLFICLHSYSQDTTRIEQYCELVASGSLLSNKVTIDVNYGEERRAWKDYKVKDENGKTQKFNSLVDALNYMGKSGWKLVNAYPTTLEKLPTYHFFFKKDFLKYEIAEP